MPLADQSVFSHYFDNAFDVVTVGASLGGVAALAEVLSGLPGDFPCPIVVVQHVSADSPAYLSEILGRHSRLDVKRATHRERLRARSVYVAAPDRHILLSGDRRLLLSDAPKVAFARPAADLLFQSAATCFSERALSVVLTGRGTDGVAGIRAVKANGGMVIAQDEATCRAFGMPSAAIASGCVDFVLPLDKIAPALVALVMVRGAASLFRRAARPVMPS